MTRMNKPHPFSGCQSTAVFPTTAQDVCDTACVDLDNWHSRRYWSERLGLNENQLVRIVRSVGSAVVRIEEYLAERRERRIRRRRKPASA